MIGQFNSINSVIIAFVILFMSMFIPTALREVAEGRTDGANYIPVVLAHFFAIALILGGLTFCARTKRVPAMGDRFCTSVLDLLNPDWANRWQGLTAHFPNNPEAMLARADRCLNTLPDQIDR